MRWKSTGNPKCWAVSDRDNEYRAPNTTGENVLQKDRGKCVSDMCSYLSFYLCMHAAALMQIN